MRRYCCLGLHQVLQLLLLEVACLKMQPILSEFLLQTLWELFQPLRDKLVSHLVFLFLNNTYQIFSHAVTTDVQAVTATFINSVNMSTILCEFLAGSNAKGCMVVLTSGGQEATYNLTKRESVNCSILTVTLVFPQSHIDQVEAFDIKANGSVSSLAIPGLLSNLLPTSCTAIDTSTCKSQCNISCSNAT